MMMMMMMMRLQDFLQEMLRTINALFLLQYKYFVNVLFPDANVARTCTLGVRACYARAHTRMHNKGQITECPAARHLFARLM